MKRLFWLSLVFPTFAFAGPDRQPSCEAWPVPLSAAGPWMAASGLPFTYNLRFDCRLDGRFAPSTLRASYRTSGSSEAIEPTQLVVPFPLLTDERLYLYQFNVPVDQPGGVYSIAGCLDVVELASGERRCLTVPPQSFELVRVDRPGLESPSKGAASQSEADSTAVGVVQLSEAEKSSAAHCLGGGPNHHPL